MWPIIYRFPRIARSDVDMNMVASHLDSSGGLPRDTHDFNRTQIHWLSELDSQHLGACEVAGILGFTDRSNMDVTVLAVGLLLVGELAAPGLRVMAFDSERRIPISQSHMHVGSFHAAVFAGECSADIYLALGNRIVREESVAEGAGQ